MSASEPLISVVIPLTKNLHLVEKTIYSVLNQSYKNVELLLIEVTPFGSEKRLKNINDYRIAYLKIRGIGEMENPKNYGIKLSKGEFISFINPGDYWLPDKLEKQVSFIRASTEVTDNLVCFSGVYIEEGDIQNSIRNNSYNKQDIMNYILVDNNLVCSSSFLLSSSLAKESLFETAGYHEDWDYCIKLRENNAEFLGLSDCLVICKAGEDRCSLLENPDDESKSLEWLEERKYQLSLSSRWVYSIKVKIGYLLVKGKTREAAKLAFIALVDGKIGILTFSRMLVAIYSSGLPREKAKMLTGE